MSFLGMGFLLGLIGIVLPLAIHIFGKKKRVIQPWGAMRFLDEAKPSWKRRTLRLQDILILLLRIAAVALLALAFARPVLKVPLPPENAHELILIVDRSPSTELGADNGERLADEIFRHTSQLLDLVPAETRVRFFLNGTASSLQGVPPDSGNPFNEPRNRNAWLRALRTQQPASNTVSWVEAIRGILDRSDVPAPLSRQVVVIADAAKHGWSSDDEKDSKLPKAWSDLAEEISGGTIFFVPIGIDHPHRQRPNLGVDHLVTDQQRIQTGAEITIRATVSNRGATANEPAKARWTESAERIVMAEGTIPALNPGEIHELILKRSFPEAGPVAIRLELDSTKDALGSDNVGSKVIEVIDRIPVAVFIDVPPDRLENPGSRFACWTLAAAAGHPDSIAFGNHGAPAGSLGTGTDDSFFELKWFTPEHLARNEHSDSRSEFEINDFAVVIWSVADNSSLNKKRFSESIRPFVSRGGGLWLRLPFKVNPSAFNGFFFPHEFGISPAGIAAIGKEVTDQKSELIGLRPPRGDSPRIFSDAVFSSLDELQVKRHLNLLDPRPPSSEVLLEFEGGNPFLIRRQLGKGKVILSTLDTDPASGNFAACVGYLPFVRELLWDLASTHSPRRNFRAGEATTSSLPDGTVRLRTPRGDWTTIDPDERNLSINAPGLYWMETPGNPVLSPISVSGVPEESETRPIPGIYFDRLDQIEGFEAFNPVVRSDLNRFQRNFVRNADVNSSAGHFSVKEIWAWFLVGLIGFLVLEVILAHHLLAQRRSSLRK